MTELKQEVSPNQESLNKFIKFLQGATHIEVAELLNILEQVTSNSKPKDINTSSCNEAVKSLNIIANTLRLYEDIYINDAKLSKKNVKKCNRAKKIITFIDKLISLPEYEKIYEPEVLKWLGIKPFVVAEKFKIQYNNSTFFSSESRNHFESIFREQANNIVLGLGNELQEPFRSLNSGINPDESNPVLIYCGRISSEAYLIRILNDIIFNNKNNNSSSQSFLRKLEHQDIGLNLEQTIQNIINAITADLSFLRKMEVQQGFKNPIFAQMKTSENQQHTQKSKEEIEKIENHLTELVMRLGNPQENKSELEDQLNTEITLYQNNRPILKTETSITLNQILTDVLKAPTDIEKFQSGIQTIFEVLKPVYKSELELYFKCKILPYIFNISATLKTNSELILEWFLHNHLESYPGFVQELLNKDTHPDSSSLRQAMVTYSEDFSNSNQNIGKTKNKKKYGKEEAEEQDQIIFNSKPNTHRIIPINNKKLLHVYSVNIESLVESSELRQHKNQMPFAILVVHILLSETERPKISDIFIYPLHPVASVILGNLISPNPSPLPKKEPKEQLEENRIKKKINNFLQFGFQIFDFLTTVHLLTSYCDDIAEDVIPEKWDELEYFINVLSKISGICKATKNINFNTQPIPKVLTIINTIHEILATKNGLLASDIKVEPEECSADVLSWLNTTFPNLKASCEPILNQSDSNAPSPSVITNNVPSTACKSPPPTFYKSKIIWGILGALFIAGSFALFIFVPPLPILLAIAAGTFKLIPFAMVMGTFLSSFIGSTLLLRGVLKKSPLITALYSLGFTGALAFFTSLPFFIAYISSLVGSIFYTSHTKALRIISLSKSLKAQEKQISCADTEDSSHYAQLQRSLGVRHKPSSFSGVWAESTHSKTWSLAAIATAFGFTGRKEKVAQAISQVDPSCIEKNKTNTFSL